MAPLLDARDLDKSYPRAGGTVHVLRRCSLSLEAGEAVAVMGPSGSGKSTLLNIVGGLDWPDAGQVRHQGAVLDLADPRAMSVWRTTGVGFVFQFHFLLPDFTARENLLLPVQARRAVDPRGPRAAPTACWRPWALRPGRTICPANCPAANSSGWPWPGRS